MIKDWILDLSESANKYMEADLGLVLDKKVLFAFVGIEIEEQVKDPGAFTI